MADAGVLKAGDRLPWLEPYRPPSRRPSNRKAGLAGMAGVAGLAAIATLLAVWIAPLPDRPAEPSAEVLLPPPSMIRDDPVAVQLVEGAETSAVQPAVAERPVATSHRGRKIVRRRIKAEPTRTAYRDVVRDQADQDVAAEPQISAEAMAIALMPAPPADPPRPVVNRSAQVVRGKTVQMGVYKTARQAEIAWRSAIRDYTYLVTMPKSIQPIRIRSKLYYRLQLGTPSRTHARQLCGNLRQTGRSCTVA
jgi:hypothetical protein